ncbi:MAG TPA: hypothetical protein VFS55_04275, partial [Dokdonella sp.]|nr:hypothetical protein [Dokdonella sp.]
MPDELVGRAVGNDVAVDDDVDMAFARACDRLRPAVRLVVRGRAASDVVRAAERLATGRNRRKRAAA